MKTRKHKKNRIASLEILEDRRMMSADLGMDFSQLRTMAAEHAGNGRAGFAVYADRAEAGTACHAADHTTIRSVAETLKTNESSRPGGPVGPWGVGWPAGLATDIAQQAHQAVMAALAANRLEHVELGGISPLAKRAPLQPASPGVDRTSQALWVSAEGGAAAPEGGRIPVPANGELPSASHAKQAMSGAPTPEHPPVSLAVTPTDGAAGAVAELGQKAASAVNQGVQKLGSAIWQAAKTAWSIVKKLPGPNMVVSSVTHIQEWAKFRNAPMIGESSLRPGDVLVFQGDGLMRSVIKYGTESGFNHAAIYAGKGMVIDAIGGGVVKRSLQDALRDQNFAGVLRREGLTDLQRLAIVRTAETWIDAKYSYKNCAYTGAGFLEITGSVRPAVTCSELVQKVYEEAIGCRIVNRNYPSPGDLALASGLKAVGRLKQEPSAVEKALRNTPLFRVVSGNTHSSSPRIVLPGTRMGGMRPV